MRFWRIAQSKWALDKSGTGARNFGGRWNPVGLAALYAGCTIEIAALEMFVHIAGKHHPPLKLVAIDIPDDPGLIHTVAHAALPKGWSDLPVSAASQKFGGEWLQATQQLVLRVPSAIVPESYNALLNPLHPAYGEVRLSIQRDFTFDGRMFK